MQIFNQNETGFTATALNVTIPVDTQYDPDVLDNPVRALVNMGVAVANLRAYQTMRGAM